ncbi:MAG TPA: deoxyribodipyrimidine photo-lyase [Acidimicrobiia bacterium]|nr:deoxyribodipyrimidine photo-lyase [Acidimicrobiia bacterium]
MSTGVVWFRRDLRLGDNPAWAAATRRHDFVVAVFVVDPRLWNRVSHRRVALLAANLGALDRGLRQLGGRLRIETGDPTYVIPEIVATTGAHDVTANADVTPYARRRDDDVARRVQLDLHHGSSVHPPGSILTQDGSRYRVFTPFSRTWFDTPFPRAPNPGVADIASDPGTSLPTTGPPVVAPGEDAALERLASFDPTRYADERDRPDLEATSRLSIDLKYGTLSPLTVIDHVGLDSMGAWSFVRQLAWRDFHAHLLDAQPSLVDRASRPQYDDIEWRDDESGFEAWAGGATGYPLVDAGMRQLLAQGWMHNRVRMVAASFLVKDLLIDWRKGERWFRHHLLDGDTPQNVGNWQWVAGSGADAAPYFRIFNPTSQSRRFDPDGDYIRRWVPELAGVPSDAIHEPWRSAPIDLATWSAQDYPMPIVDHAAARERTLAAYSRAMR